MIARLHSALAGLFTGPQTHAAIQDRIKQLELENKALRERVAQTTLQINQVLEGIAQYRSNNQSLYVAHQTVAEAHATRNLALRDHILNEMADGWRASQALLHAGRIH